MNADLLVQAMRERRALTLRNAGKRVGLFPLWPVPGAHGRIDFVAIAWKPYRVERLEVDAWEWLEADNRGSAPTVPVVEFVRRIRPRRYDDQLGRDVEDLRRLIEVLALVERFELKITIGYEKTPGSLEVRHLERVVTRGEAIVAADLDRSAARSFRFDRIAWVEPVQGSLGVRWDPALEEYAPASLLQWKAPA